MIRADKFTPMPGWVLCKMLEPSKKTKGGLFFGRDLTEGKTSEGVCEVLAVTPEVVDHEKIDPGFEVGDVVVFREFLKKANPVGELFGESRDDGIFLLNYKDVLSVVPPGEHISLGFWGEFAF